MNFTPGLTHIISIYTRTTHSFSLRAFRKQHGRTKCDTDIKTCKRHRKHVKVTQLRLRFDSGEKRVNTVGRLYLCWGRLSACPRTHRANVRHKHQPVIAVSGKCQHNSHRFWKYSLPSIYHCFRWCHLCVKQEQAAGLGSSGDTRLIGWI